MLCLPFMLAHVLFIILKRFLTMKFFSTLFKQASFALLVNNPVIKTALLVLLILFSNFIAVGQTVIVQAESGTLGSQYTSGTDGSTGYVTVGTPLVDGNFPGANRIVSYNITFPAAGTYDLYMRIKVGPEGGNDDSYFYGSGFGAKDPVNGAQWITVNNVTGFSNSADIVMATGGGTETNIWKWVKLSGANFGEAGVTFNVPAGSLTQTFQIGGREDGLQIDKFAFSSPTGLFFTVAMLDNGQEGFPTPPGEKYPLTVQAESGTLGSNFTTATQTTTT